MINNVVIMGRLTKRPGTENHTIRPIRRFLHSCGRPQLSEGWGASGGFFECGCMEADSRVCGEILRERLHDCHSGINSNAKI